MVCEVLMKLFSLIFEQLEVVREKEGMPIDVRR